MGSEPTRSLVERGQALFARLGADRQRPAGDVVRRLVAAYGEEHRGYHDVRHLAEVLDHVDALAAQAVHPDRVRLAAWFHDAVYVASARPGADEEASAHLAVSELTTLGTAPEVVADVARLVRLTATHRPADGDRDGAVLCDADLAVLARDPSGYARYVAGVRKEYAHVPEADFRAGRAAVLRALADQPNLFRTTVGRERWEATARRNVADELARLTAD